jgi:large subunit ribosomal protein L21
MYAVIKTGGKQYRVQPGDTIVVEKLDGDAGSELKFDSVLMLGGDKGVTLGAPLIDGAFVGATLIETRKGEKVKIFKKTRRQGYRRTNGHRQQESVLRVTGLTGADGKATKWDGTVDLTTKADLDARARNLAPRVEAEAKPAKKAAAPKAEAKTETKPKAKAAPKKAAAKTSDEA